MRQRRLMIGAVLLVSFLAIWATAAGPGPIPRVSRTDLWQPAHAADSVQGTSVLGTSSGPYDEKADAARDIAAALALARSDKKNVLLDFGGNWCPDCVVLSKIFEDKSVKPFLDANFHVVKIDVGRWNKNLDLVKKYGNPIEKGVPAVVVLDPAEHIVASTKGGELESARTATAEEILAYLKRWAPRRP